MNNHKKEKLIAIVLIALEGSDKPSVQTKGQTGHIHSGSNNKAYLEGWENIFGNKQEPIQA